MVGSASGAVPEAWSGLDSWAVFASGELSSFCGGVVSGVGVASGPGVVSGVVEGSGVEPSFSEGVSSVDGSLDGEVSEDPSG
ncbi:hypothetical protein ACWC9R_18005 [Streptomyces sp. NPDC001219]